MDREVVHPADGKSGAVFERFRADGRAYFVKRTSPDRDWVMRVTGDRDFRTHRIWRAGILHRAAGVVEHAIVDVTVEDDELVVLMRDVGDALVPPGDGVVPQELHRALLTGLAGLSALFAGWRDDLGLMPMGDRFRTFAPVVIAPELAGPAPSGVLQAAGQGWARLEEGAAEYAAVARAVHARPEALAAALDRTPTTFVHGDWKLGNLGRAADGRPVLLDWAFPGAGPACWDLGWYLCLNAARIPEPKEDAAEAFRSALERHGVVTAGWFDHQLALGLLAVAATFGWEKALGGSAELDWWAERALRGARLLDREEPGWR